MQSTQWFATLQNISLKCMASSLSLQTSHSLCPLTKFLVSLKDSHFEAVLDSVQATVDANPGIVIAVLDHISSYPAALLPIKEMVAICQKKGIFVLVDGAHALGLTHEILRLIF